MPSTYLAPDDYASFGVPQATAAQVTQSSIILDGYLDRPAGMMWVAGGDGQPCYMSSLSADITLIATAAFGPATQVTVPVTGALAMLQIGDCLTIDRETADLTEAVQVIGMDYTAGTITLGTQQAVGPNGVLFAHASGTKLERGLQIEQTKDVPKNRPMVQLDYCPIARVVGGSGRYGYPRRADSNATNMDDFNLLASLQKFGGPPAWEIWPANTAAGIEPRTGNLWVPAGIMLAYYSEISVRYVAGFSAESMPAAIKLACAQILTAQLQNPSLGNIKALQAGQSRIEFITNSALSSDVTGMLAPYRSSGFA